MSDSKTLRTKRFLEVVELLKKGGYADTDAEVYKSIGVSTSKYNDIKHGRGRYVTADMMNDIADKFPVNVLYILREEGEPLTVPVGNGKGVSEEKSRTEAKSVIVTVDQSGSNMAMVDTKAAATYSKNCKDPDYFKKQLPILRLPQKKYKKGIIRAFQVDGISMARTFNHNEWVIGRYVEDYNNIVDGGIYVVVTKKSVAIKRLFKHSEKDKIELVNDNKTYKPYTLSLRDVIEMWRVEGPLNLNI